MSDAGQNLPATSEERDEIIYRMRAQGQSLSEIAQELGVTYNAAFQAVNSRLAKEASYQTDEERARLLALENARLDIYLRKLWPSVEYGDVKAIGLAIRISETRAKINDLTSPTSTNTTQVLVVGGETQSYVESLKQITDVDH